MSSNRSKNRSLAVRPKVLEGELVDVELDALIARYGIMGAIQRRMWQRYDDKMMREIFKPECFVPGANVELPMIEIADRGN
jgi:hypothetical protein